jgi:hypothetical protein
MGTDHEHTYKFFMNRVYMVRNTNMATVRNFDGVFCGVNILGILASS